MAASVSGSVTGDIAIAVLRRQNLIPVPVYVWTGTPAAWVEFQAMTGTQFSAWVNARLASSVLDPDNPGDKIQDVTMSRTNDW